MSMKEIADMSKIDYEDLYQDNKIVLKRIICNQICDIETFAGDMLMADNSEIFNEAKNTVLSLIDKLKNNIINYNM